jgi:hypothetical protein
MQTVNYGGNGTTVTAVPDASYHFVSWSDGSTENPRTETNVTEDLDAIANFASDTSTTFTLTYTAGLNGSLTGQTVQTVNYGGNGTAVTAVPDTSYHFVSWSDGSTENPRTETNVTADVNVTANFGGDNVIYVAPNGIGGAAGTIDDPTTFASAVTRIQPGGIIYMRGGTYSYNTTQRIAWLNDGTSNARKQLFAFPGETPVLNFATQPVGNGSQGVILAGSYWHVKGLIIEYAGDNGMSVQGSYNTVERVVTRFNKDTGLQLAWHASGAPPSEWPSYNLILSSESHDNKDPGNENADGFYQLTVDAKKPQQNLPPNAKGAEFVMKFATSARFAATMKL